MNYRSEVAAIKRLTKEIDQGEAAIEAAKWERGKRVAELVDEGYSRRQIAGDVGVSPSTVSAWVEIWQGYGRVAARQRPRYTDADYEVRNRGAGFGNSEPAIVAGATKLQHGNKVEIARKLLADPEVAEDVMRDDRTRRRASKAVESAAVETVRESAARDRERYPQDTADRDVLAIVSFINDADERAKAALRVIRGGLEVTDELRPALLDAIERLENTTSWLRTVVESTHRTTDEALDAILRGER